MSPEIIQRLTSVRMSATALREVLSIVADMEPMRTKRQERNHRHYTKRLNSDGSKTPNSDAIKTPHASEIKTPPSPPLSSPTPPPIAPTPEHKHEAPVREGPAHKRIQWTPEAGWTGITDTDRKLWTASAPACDLNRQLASAGQWLRENPTKSHKSNFYRFFGNWLRKAQDRGGDTPSTQNGNHRPTHRPAQVISRNTAELPFGRPSLNAAPAKPADGIPDGQRSGAENDEEGGTDDDF